MHEVWLNYEKDATTQLKATRDPEKVMDTWRAVKPVSAIVLRPTDKVAPPFNEQPVLFTREVASEYFGGIDLRSTSEWWRDTLSGLTAPLRRRRQHPSTQLRSNAAEYDVVVAAVIPIDFSSNETKDEKKTMTVGIMIAMPDPSRPRYDPQQSPLAASSSRVDQQSRPPGKRKALVPLIVNADGEVELPDIALGVIESDWTGKPSLAQHASRKKEAQLRHTLRGYGMMARVERQRAERETARQARRT